MLRDYWTPVLPAFAIGLLSIASGGDTFTGLQEAFGDLPNGLIIALVIAAGLRVSFFLFAEKIGRREMSGWVKGCCLVGVLLVMAASALAGTLPGSFLTPLERLTLDALILGLIGFKNAYTTSAPPDSGHGSNASAPPSSTPPSERAPSPANGLELVELLDRYTVEELGGLFLYAPKPEVAGLPRLQPWILLLQARKVIKNEPWVVYPDGIRAKVRQNYPHLIENDPDRFYIYRLDKEALAKLIASL